ncbi:MAG: preprotein translocase subunit SecG [Rhodanobacteraceae bacterium]|jgi:preprotein translocase subunit SecG|nr:preprotein translocase subunit SecG [Rhodanobacteraceae bacterium]MBL0041513.1 preprotein translocase subunit SecG [Xanthomonadales bacterium]MBP6078176.1 preprotein translocase subunit SecG [Xanthomonadales bacterium]MBP7623088.1 preprotein translocase subunit SecG [Xanthomonadales bacterium]
MSFELGLKILLALYVVVALAMIGLILLQRGSGAQAGSGFGGGASATVFGSRGSANFLSSSTKWLAVLFFALSIGMGVYISHNAKKTAGAAADLGVMGAAQTPAEVVKPAAAPAPANGDVPVAPTPTSDVPAATDAKVAAPVDTTQVEATDDAKTNESTQPESSN